LFYINIRVFLSATLITGFSVIRLLQQFHLFNTDLFELNGDTNISVYVNHTQQVISSWNQLVPSQECKVSCSRRQ